MHQHRVKDCSILALMIGIFSSPGANVRIEKMCSINDHGDLVMKLDFSGIDPFLQSKESLRYLKDKGITIDIAKGGGSSTVTFSGKKMAYIIGAHHQTRHGNKIKGVTTNSLFIIAMEHLIGNFAALRQGDKPPKNGMSLHAFNQKINSSLLYEWVSKLLNYKNAYSKSGGVIYPRKMSHMLKYCEDFDAQKIGTAYHQDKGAVVVSIDQGKVDSYGQMHGRHAFALNKVVRDPETNQIVALELINPWDRKETYTLEDLLKRNIAFKFFTPK